MDGYTDALVVKATELWWPSLTDVSRHPLRPERSFFAAVTNTAVPFPSTTSTTSLLDNHTITEGVSSVGLSRLGCSVFATATLQYSQLDTTTDKDVAAKMCVSVWSPFTSAELILPVVYCPPDLTSALQNHEEGDKKVKLMEFALSGRIRIVPADVATYCARHIHVSAAGAQDIESDEALRDLLFARYSATMQSCIATFLRSADCEGGYCGILIDGAEDSGKAEFVRHVQQKMPACFDVVNTNNSSGQQQQGQSYRTRYVVESRKINLAHVMSLDEREAIETVTTVLQPPLTHSSQQQCTTRNSDETSKVVQSEYVMLRPLVFVTIEHVDLLWSEPLAQAPLIAQCVAHELCTRLDQLTTLNSDKSGAVFCICSVAESGVGEAMPLLRRLAQDGQLRLEVPTLEERVRYMRLKLKHVITHDDNSTYNTTSNGEEEEDVWQAALEMVAEGMSTVTIPQLLALSTETLHARVQAALETHNTNSDNTISVTHSVASSSPLQHAPPTSTDDITMTTYYGHLFGLADMIRRVEELIVWPLTHLPLLRKMNIPCPRGLLLLGSSGTGKTALLSALARRLHGLHRTGLHTIVLDGLSLLTKEVGRSERNIAELFARARALAPTAIFLDNLDALAPPRGKQSQESNMTADRTLSTLLTEMDGVQVDGAHLVIVLASAPSLSCLDAAVYRPGRLDIHLTLPRLTSTVAARAVMTRLAAFHTRMHNEGSDSDEWRQAVQDFVEGYVSAHTQSGTGSEVSAAQLVAAVRDVLLYFVQHPDTPWQGEVLVRLLRKALNET